MSDCAVHIRQACKRYGGSKSTWVLHDLDMSVSKGCIYGLLGASGCGKTTLLSCIVGRLGLNSGSIEVLGEIPGSRASGVPGHKVGYMPQDIALPAEFTVKNAIFYFGWLFNMSNKELCVRYEFLSQLLDLPDDDLFIKKLSGGQQRRVSLASAMVHDPELLILDEPTVGVDPILRQSIWDYLAQITSSKRVTAIITTHYIEEAMQAHMIGLMRMGKLLAEDSPQKLLSVYNCPTLEDVFLTLSINQGGNMEEENNSSLEALIPPSIILKKQSIPDIGEVLPIGDKYKEKKLDGRNVKKFSLNWKLSSFSRLWALLIKNYYATIRNPGGLAFVALFPILQLSLFFFAIGDYPTGLILAVVNEELDGYATCSDLKNHNGTETFNNGTDECRFHGISCMYLDLLNDSILIKEYYPEKEQAVAKVQAGKAIGLLYFSRNFTERINERYLHGKYATDHMLEESEIQVHMDMTDQQTAALIKVILYEQYGNLVERLAVACNMDSKSVRIPVRFNEPVYGNRFPKYDTFMAPGVLTSTVFFLATTISASLIVTERTQGIWNRNLVAGVTYTEILLSYFLSQILCVLLQSVEVLIMSIFVFGLECHGSMITLLGIITLQGVCGMMFGLLISVLSKNFTMAVFMSLGSYIPFINLCGVLWPIEGMPLALRWLSLFMPGTLATLSISNILEKGWGILHPGVYHGFLMTSAWIIGQLLFSISVLRLRDMKVF